MYDTFISYGVTPENAKTCAVRARSEARSWNVLLPFVMRQSNVAKVSMSALLSSLFISNMARLRSPSQDVLIEADKRGIDSHGIGRLKPIYCDR